MSASLDPPKYENTYLIDPESSSEWVRLMDMNGLITRHIGGLFPLHKDISDISDVLDLACGPGGWVLDVAFTYPSIEVVGVDLSETVIRYGQSRAKVQQLNNAHFYVMDVLRPFDFPDSSFDTINARFLSGLLPATSWRALLQECNRVTRPNGSILVTEMELILTNSPASESLFGMYTQAMKRVGYGFSPNGAHLGTTPVLARFLRETGYRDITQQAHLIDFSAGTRVHEAFSENLRVFYKLLQPFIIATAVSTIEEFNSLYDQATVEMLADDFCAWSLVISVFGTRT